MASASVFASADTTTTGFAYPQSSGASVCWYDAASWSNAVLSAVLASETDSERSTSPAIPLTELANSLLAASTSLRRSLLRSDCAPEMDLRSLLIASTLCVTASLVTVPPVRLFSSSTCLPMSAVAAQTVACAFSAGDCFAALSPDESPQAPNATESIATARTDSTDLI